MAMTFLLYHPCLCMMFHEQIIGPRRRKWKQEAPTDMHASARAPTNAPTNSLTQRTMEPLPGTTRIAVDRA